MSVILRLSDELAPAVAGVLRQVSSLFALVLPTVEFHHIGATAISGALTKGDLDVLLRVAPAEFAQAAETLKQLFDVKQPENWTSVFASFGSDTGYALPLGVQLAVKDSDADFFLFIHDCLSSNACLLADYNQAKRENAGNGEAEYRAAKERVLSPIVALMKRPA